MTSKIAAMTNVVEFARNNILKSVGLGFAATFFGLLSWYITSYIRSPLRKYPGPFLAGKRNTESTLSPPAASL
jgi:hypothetical protein